MLDLESAKSRILTYLNNQNTILNDALAIREDFIIEKEYGWIFSYDSKIFLEAGEFRYRRVGNYPLLIFKDSGEIYPVNNISVLKNLVDSHNKMKSLRND
jgi:hypothetical protein